MANKTQDLEHRAREQFGFIPTSGIAGRDKDAIRYGLENGLFTQDEVNAAQKKYEATHRRK